MVTADAQTSAVAFLIGAGVLEHLFLDAQDVAGVVDEDRAGAGGAQTVVLAAEQGRAHHLFHTVKVARKG